MVAREGEQERRVTRREALRAGGACAGGAAMLGLLGGGAGQALLDRLGRTGRAAADALSQNAILIVTDSTRADHLGAYGSKLGLTPNLDALAHDGVTFTRAHPESMSTGPARDTLLTGDRQFPFATRASCTTSPAATRRSPPASSERSSATPAVRCRASGRPASSAERAG